MQALLSQTQPLPSFQLILNQGLNPGLVMEGVKSFFVKVVLFQLGGCGHSKDTTFKNSDSSMLGLSNGQNEKPLINLGVWLGKLRKFSYGCSYLETG